MEVTLDTHSLIWYVDKSLNKKLSKTAFDIIQKAEISGVIYIPIIVLMEVLYLIEKGRINLSFKSLIKNIETSINYKIISFDIEILKLAENLTGLEAHDRLILATSIKLNSYLVTKDKELKGKNIVW